LSLFEKRFGQKVEESPLPLDALLQNLGLSKQGQLTLAGLLLFGRSPENFRSDLQVKAVAFVGNDLAGITYRDSEDIGGDLEAVFQRSMAFLKRNLRYTQQGQNFNSVGKLEVPEIALEELMVNALLHRDYLKNAPVRLLIFDDRVEIISPGRLPNGLSEESIRYGNAVVRNHTLVNIGTKILPYRGLGSGVPRALAAHPGTVFFNDVAGDQFRVTLPRELG
jgi:ATP-dependent DNA helicase RecG